jgi:hypothetical protein
MKILSHNYTGKSLVVVFSNGKGVQTKIVEKSHPSWKCIFSLYKEGRMEEVVPLMDVGTAIQAKFGKKFTVADGKVFFDGREAGGYLIDRILFFLKEVPNQANRLVKFAENLYENPNPYVIDELYKFLEHKGFTITDDGCFLAYKGVSPDYFSISSGDIEVLLGTVKKGRIYNGVGQIIIVKRSQVCSDKEIGCASGLHVGSWEYANDFKGNGHLMVVKVNPKNVVSVPRDCDWKKCRVCEYEVIAEEGRKLHEVKDSNFDKVSAVRQKFNRDSLGRFAPAK